MFINFFLDLRNAKVPVTLREYLVLLEAMEHNLANYKVEDFYYLSRALMVKDERNLDKFDRVFGQTFKGIEYLNESDEVEIPEEWLKLLAEKVMTPEEMAKIKAMGGLEKLLEELKKRIEEQKKRHEGGNKAVGTGGTSPFGANGYNPEGVRMRQNRRRHGRAVKVWEKREFKNYDDTLELGTRNIKMALRRLRQFAREGIPTELDLDDTIRATAHNGGLLDIRMVPERRNKVKVLIFFDVGGSMDSHIRTCEELFSATRAEFKHLEYFYFHNCLYESVWKDNRRRHSEKIDTWEVLNTYQNDYKVIIVGDATMSPYEISYAGGSVEHWNEEAGELWMTRLLTVYPQAAWLNPVPRRHWDYTPSIQQMSQIMSGRMYPLTLLGLDAAMRELNR